MFVSFVAKLKKENPQKKWRLPGWGRKDEILERLAEIERIKPWVSPKEKIALVKEKRALDIEIGKLFDLDDEILKNL